MTTFPKSYKSNSILLLLIVLFLSCADREEPGTADLPSDSAITTTIQTQLKAAEGVPQDSI